MKVISKHATLAGAVSVPGSKSHTIRASLFAGLSKGISNIHNPLPSEDCLSAIKVLKDFGCSVEVKKGEWIIKGIGKKWSQPGFVIDVGNSGTLLYLLTGIVSTISGYSVITGDKSICMRPIENLLQAIRQLGAQAFTTRENVDAPPIIVKGPLHAGVTRLKGTLSQHVSSMLIAASLLDGKTRIEVTDPKEIPFVKMTISWLEFLGVQLDFDKNNYRWFEIEGLNEFPSFDTTIPSDWESLAFPLVAAVLTNSTITIYDIDTSDAQGDRAIIDVLRDMGADIEIDVHDKKLIVKGGNALKGVTANLSDFPDALPILTVAAAFADGVSCFADIGVCRLKESDRVALMNKELTKLGVHVVEGDDYLEIYGFGGKGLHGGEVKSYGDHRIAMALAVFGLALEPENRVIINNAECCAVSFPQFYEVMNTIGAGFEILED